MIKAADVLVNLLAGKPERDSTENVGAFPTTMISQRLSIQSVLRLLLFGRKLKVKFRKPQFWGLGEC